MVGRSTVDFEVLAQWIATLRKVHWPGPIFLQPEIYSAGAWIGVVPLRNLVTYHALKRAEEWDDLLWIDADHRISTGLIERIEEHAGRYGILGGPYFGRDWPFEIQAVERVDDDKGFRLVSPERLVPILQAGTPAVLEVLGVGTGCMLVRKDVLLRMRDARGEGDVWHAGRIPWETQLRLIEAGESVSGVETEDYRFCRDAYELLGERTYLDLDPRMETGHVGRETRDRRHYLAAHVVHEGQDVDEAALARKGYRLQPIPRGNRAQRRAHR
jgi:hypothetical protein